MPSPALPATVTVTTDAVPDVVIDTNVLLDWLLFRDASVAALAQAVIDGRLRWVSTEAMLGELAHVLGRPFDPRWPVDASAIVAAARRHACIVEAPAVAGPALPCRDPDDQKFIDLALAWPARWLFSRDRALLHLARRAAARGVVVLAPAQWQPPPRA